MIDIKKIYDLIGEHTPPYIYNKQTFENNSNIYYSGPYWDKSEIAYAIYAILNGKWITAGENVYKFEREFSKKFNVKHSHMVNSGSSANLIMIASLKKFFNWNDEDEIIVSAVGFPTTISVLIQNKLKPIFVDIEWNTLNFDVSLIENLITEKTKAIFVSPVLGNPPDMDLLESISKKYNLQLIGDNCDSLGSKWNNKLLTDYYVAFSNSFYPAHHITTGEGGMICTNIDSLKELFVSFSWWGRDCYCVGSSNLLSCGTCGKRFDKWLDTYDDIIDHKYVFSTIGYNLKPLDLQGAIGLEQLKKFDEIEVRRNYAKQTLTKIFIENIDGIRTPDTHNLSEPCWFGTPFICDDVKLKKDLVEYLEKNKIQTRNYFAGNILMHPAYSNIDDFKKYPNANDVLSRVFFIGAAPHYSEQTFEYIEKIVKDFKK